MIIDTSAILAIFFEEAEADQFISTIAAASSRRMSAASLLETTIVLESRSGPTAAHELDEFLRRAQIELEAVTPEQAQTARQAWRRFRKGNHPAGLNFGDCFSYALAAATREPLLFKGRDFELTDIPAA